MEAMERFFRLKENGTTWQREVVGGGTTFMSMAYILVVNPAILSAAGMPYDAVFLATLLSSAFGSIAMGLLGRLPFGLAPGMGLNAYFAYTVCGAMGVPWQTAMMAILIEGIIFGILSLMRVREAVINAIPMGLKAAISIGIGFFITNIALQNSSVLVKDSATGLALYDFNGGNFQSQGILVIITIIGIILTLALVMNPKSKVGKAGILIGMILTWIMAMVAQAAGLYVPNPEIGAYSMFPDFSNGFVPLSALKSTFCQLSFNGLSVGQFIPIMLAFFCVDFLDTAGTFVGVATQADMLDDKGNLPNSKMAFLADALATIFGALTGTSTVTTFVESSAGVAAGARTGLAAIVTGILFLVSYVASPIVTAIPGFATTPALVAVGVLMMKGSIKRINWEDMVDAAPAFACIVIMCLGYSISEGICAGVIFFVLLALAKKERRIEINPIIIGMAILFVLKYAFV